MSARARCNTLSAWLAQVWNNRTAVELELRERAIDPARRASLTERLRELCAEGDRLEGEMTKAVQALAAEYGLERASA